MLFHKWTKLINRVYSLMCIGIIILMAFQFDSNINNHLRCIWYLSDNATYELIKILKISEENVHCFWNMRKKYMSIYNN